MEERGEAFIKRSCTRSGRMGLTWGQRDASPNKDFGWNEQACLLGRLNCPGGGGDWEGSGQHFTWQSQRPAALSRIRYQNIVE